MNEIHTWHAQRLARLQADTGYLALAGLFWLADGEHTLGSDAANAIVLPAHSAPPQAGVLVRSGDTTVLRALPGAGLQHDGKPVDEMTLVSDAAGAPTVIAIGDLTFSLIKRGDRYAIRLRDKQSAIRKNFRGIECFPIDTAYKVPARFVPYSPPKKIPIANVVGTVDTMLSPGALVFTLHGQECRLDPVWEGPEDDSLWLIFRDATSGDETPRSTGRSPRILSHFNHRLIALICPCTVYGLSSWLDNCAAYSIRCHSCNSARSISSI